MSPLLRPEVQSHLEWLQMDDLNAVIAHKEDFSVFFDDLPLFMFFEPQPCVFLFVSRSRAVTLSMEYVVPAAAVQAAVQPTELAVRLTTCRFPQLASATPARRQPPQAPTRVQLEDRMAAQGRNLYVHLAVHRV